MKKNYITDLETDILDVKILGSAIQHASDAIIVFDANGEIRSWNRGAKIIFGYKKEEMVGEHLEKLFSLSQISGFFQQTNGYYNFELTSAHKNKRKLVICATLTSIQNGDKSVIYYLLIARDITNQCQFEEELALKHQKIQEAYKKFGIIKREMDYIYELLGLLNSRLDKKSIGDYIVSSLIMLTHTDACILRIYNPEKDTLDLAGSFGVQDWNGKSSIKFQNSLAQKAHQKKSMITVIDLSNETRYQSMHLAKKNNLASLLIIPLQFHGEILGCISLYTNPEKKVTVFENEFLEKYARIIEVAMYATFFKK